MSETSVDLSILIGDSIDSEHTFSHFFVARPLKFDRFCLIHHWKAKNLLFSTVCCNINLVKPFGNYGLLNTGSTAKNLRCRRDHSLSAWNQCNRQS